MTAKWIPVLRRYDSHLLPHLAQRFTGPTRPQSKFRGRFSMLWVSPALRSRASAALPRGQSAPEHRLPNGVMLTPECCQAPFTFLASFVTRENTVGRKIVGSRKFEAREYFRRRSGGGSGNSLCGDKSRRITKTAKFKA